MDEDKEDLVDHIQGILGHLPPDTRLILQALAHPAIIEHTQAYFGKLDNTTRCLRYAEPWSCVQEAEAKYESIMHGWSAAAGTYGKEMWCDNCKPSEGLEGQAEAIAEALRDETLSEEETAILNAEALHILETQMEEKDE